MLQDLGIHYDEDKVNEKELDAYLEERAWKLERHKLMGHVTMGLMTASFVTAMMARNRRKNRGWDGRGPITLHKNLGYTTALSYYYTAYLSLTAPKPTNFDDEHERKIHKHMAYIHFPTMILAPILGTIANNQWEKDGKTSGLGKLAKPVMYAGALSFFAAWGVMTF